MIRACCTIGLLAVSGCGLRQDPFGREEVDLTETWPNHGATNVAIDTRLILWWEGSETPVAVHIKLMDLASGAEVMSAQDLEPEVMNIGFVDLSSDLLPDHDYALVWRTDRFDFLTEPPEFSGLGYSGAGYSAFSTGSLKARAADNTVEIIQMTPETWKINGEWHTDLSAVIDDGGIDPGVYWEIRDIEDRVYNAGVGQVPVLRSSQPNRRADRPDREICVSARSFNQAGAPGAESQVACTNITSFAGCNSAAAPRSMWLLLPLLLVRRRRT